eukprot:TRINITY_DN185_c0_g1_i2.p1 TRINITY_DN185_c0_g1~~TRINITY_DN185_c0_g1_i2.p1  ORF type:complete len:554 (-),score=76.92 TRINITY_DN185_c0_g1_i2:125-1786(-)
MSDSEDSQESDHDDDDAGARRVLDALFARLDLLLRCTTCFSHAFDPQTATAEALETAAAELPAMAAEHASTMEVLEYFKCWPQQPMRGLAALTALLSCMEQKLAALERAINWSGGRDKKRTCTEAPARAEVLGSRDLLKLVVRFAAHPNEWLYLSLVSRQVRAAYMAVAVKSKGAPSLFTTAVEAAVTSHTRLEFALLSESFAIELATFHLTTAFYRAVGRSGSLPLIQRVQTLAGPYDAFVCGLILEGAARACNVALSQTLHKVEFKEHEITEQRWVHVGMQLAEHGDDGCALSWLSAQLPKPAEWPPWFTTALCQRAAWHKRLRTLQFLMQYGPALFGPLQTFSVQQVDEFPGNTLSLWSSDAVMTVLDEAAYGGDMRVVSWLLEETHFELSGITFQAAAARGHFALLKWLYERGCPHDMNEICVCSLQHGISISVLQLQWVRTHGGGDWSPQGLSEMLGKALQFPTCYVAQWLRSEGAPWPADLPGVLRPLLRTRRPIETIETILWALQQGCPWGDWTSEMCGLMAKSWPLAKQVLHSLPQRCPCKCCIT